VPSGIRASGHPGIRAVNVAHDVMAASHGSRDGESAVARHSKEQFDASITWEDLAWLREVTSLPLVLKGVLTGEDAELAVKHGVSGLVVSNHGGRQLDLSRSAPDALAEIVDAVAGQCAVVLDGGVRTAPTSPRPCAWARTR
jgi:4-hydroxymandelate oxidase